MRCGLPPLIFYETSGRQARHRAEFVSVNPGEALLVAVSEMCCKSHGKTLQVRFFQRIVISKVISKNDVS